MVVVTEQTFFSLALSVTDLPRYADQDHGIWATNTVYHVRSDFRLPVARVIISLCVTALTLSSL